MMPLMAFEITFSMEILKNYLPVFIEKCIRGIEANRERCEAYYISSPSLAPALNPLIGSAAAAEIATESAKTGPPIVYPRSSRLAFGSGISGVTRFFNQVFAFHSDRRPYQ